MDDPQKPVELIIIAHVSRGKSTLSSSGIF